MKNKLTEKDAHKILYSHWENGFVPNNFTEQHTEYSAAIKFIMIYGYFNYNDFIFWTNN